MPPAPPPPPPPEPELPELPKYKIDENEQIVIDEIIEEPKEEISKEQQE